MRRITMTVIVASLFATAMRLLCGIVVDVYEQADADGDPFTPSRDEIERHRASDDLYLAEAAETAAIGAPLMPEFERLIEAASQRVVQELLDDLAEGTVTA
jgi:hypothetical protein